MALNLPGALASSSRPPRPPPPPELLLDSGASMHLVGHPRLLSNLRDAPAGTRALGADGNTFAVTKIGDIRTQCFTIPHVHFAPGIVVNLISVHVLTRSRICTFFDGDRATLYAGRHLVGEAVAPQGEDGLYVLQSLSVPNSDLDGQIRLLPVWSFGSVICWLKALIRERLFGSGPEEKPAREPHGSNRIIRRERRRKKGKNSGKRR